MLQRLAANEAIPVTSDSSSSSADLFGHTRFDYQPTRVKTVMGAVCARTDDDGGDLEVIEWLHTVALTTHRSEGCSSKAMSGAAVNSHLDMVK